jgi:hypothetical protein
MAKKLTVGFRDINGVYAATHFWCNNEAEALLCLQNLANLSNAQIINATMAETVDITGLASNAAAAANNESARTKAKIKMRGADAGSVADPFGHVTVSIPAPIGSLINGINGDITNAAYNDIKAHAVSASGVSMTEVTRVYYARAR